MLFEIEFFVYCFEVRQITLRPVPLCYAVQDFEIFLLRVVVVVFFSTRSIFFKSYLSVVSESQKQPIEEVVWSEVDEWKVPSWFAIYACFPQKSLGTSEEFSRF